MLSLIPSHDDNDGLSKGRIHDYNNRTATSKGHKRRMRRRRNGTADLAAACLAATLCLCGAASPPAAAAAGAGAAFALSSEGRANLHLPTTMNSLAASTPKSVTCRHLFPQDDASSDNGQSNDNDGEGMPAIGTSEDRNDRNQLLRAGLDALISAQVDEDISREAIGDKGGSSNLSASASGGSLSSSSSYSSSANDGQSTILWDVYVCQSKPCKERGSGATLDAFVGLAPADCVSVHPAIIGKTRGKGPIVRCLRRSRNAAEEEDDQEDMDNAKGKANNQNDNADNSKNDAPNDGEESSSESPLDAFEVSNVDSVDKVYRILTRHMGLDGRVDPTACECLRWNYQGNSHLERQEIGEAIACYDRAIATGYADQEGVVLLMRSTAYLKRSFQHQAELRRVVEELEVMVPRPENLQALFVTAGQHPMLARTLHEKVIRDCRLQEKQFRQIKFYHSLYEYALLHAAQDSLRATQLLPHYSKSWIRAGDALAELRKLREAARYYERAMEIDDGLVESLMPVVERLRASQQFLDEARAMGWPEDTLRLALDVSG